MILTDYTDDSIFERLLCALTCAKHFSRIILLNSCHNSMSLEYYPYFVDEETEV